jgi:hypothetical protein
MTERVPPISAVVSGTPTPAITRVGDRRESERRSAERRARDEAKKQASTSRELVPVGKPVHHDPAGPAARKAPLTEAQAAAAAFAAQVLGQGGQRNGIKGGPPVMDNARSTYLGAQYSGEQERRPPVGTNTRKDV